MLDLVGNPEDRFFHNEAQIKLFLLEIGYCVKDDIQFPRFIACSFISIKVECFIIVNVVQIAEFDWLPGRYNG